MYRTSSGQMTNKSENTKAKPSDIEGLLGTSGQKPFYVTKSFWVILFLFILAAVGAYYYFVQSSNGRVGFITQPMQKGDLTVEVSANGTINPVRTVSLGSELSGIVRKVNVDVNDPVKQGQILIELDDTKLKASVERARATLALSKASLSEAQATLKEAKAKLSRLQEVRRLSGGRSPSKTEIDAQEALVAKSEAAEESARAKIVDSEQALKSAESDLSKTHIISPIDGVVLARSVEPGYAVAASLQAVELLKLATDLKDLELQVNIDEADVGAVKPGQKASFTVSAYPDRKFPADLKKVAFGSTKTDNVITYVTYLDVKNPDNALRPGMTATATIRTVALKDALLVPNTALRFRPSVQTEAKSQPSGSLFGPPMRRNVKKSAGSVVSPNAAQKKVEVYVVKSGEAVPVPIVIGYTDGKMTQVVSSDLKAGDEVIVDQKRGAK